MWTTKSQTDRLLVQPRKMSLMSAVRHRMRVNAAGGLAADRRLSTITQSVPAYIIVGSQSLMRSMAVVMVRELPA